MNENPWKPRRPPADPRDVAPQPRRLSALRREQESAKAGRLARKPGTSAAWQVLVCCLVMGLLLSAGWMLSGELRNQTPDRVASPALGTFLALAVPDAQADQIQVASATTESSPQAEKPKRKRRKTRERSSRPAPRIAPSRPAAPTPPASAPTPAPAQSVPSKADSPSRSKPDPKPAPEPDPEPYQEPINEGGEVYDPEESDVIGPHGDVVGQRYP